MPVFGEYETDGEPFAVTTARDQTATIWRVRKDGARDGRQYMLKCVATHPKVRQDQSEEKLAADAGLEFIEAVKQLKKAQVGGGHRLAPMHDFGTSDSGVWYVTDYCKRGSLKTWVNLRGGVDDAALRQVVGSVVAGCQMLRRSCGRSHGNLKLSNVLLGGKSQSLRKTPLLLIDPLPVASAQVSHLAADDRRLVDNIFEVQDLRAIGELILQLVEGRLVESGFDYNYPIASSPAWKKLGKDEQRWRELCNRLIDPQLILDKINLDSLAKEFRSSSTAKNLLITLLVLVVLGAAGAGIYFKVAGGFEKHYEAAQNAYDAKNGVQAQVEINAALADRRDDPKALALAKKISVLVDVEFQSATNSAGQAMASQDWRGAMEDVGQALKLKPKDEQALALKNKIDQEKNYQTAMQAGREAFDIHDYQKAIDEANLALGIKREDSAAVEMLTNATTKRNAKMTADQLKQQYDEAMRLGDIAYSQSNSDEAIRQAGMALKITPGDSQAAALEKKANAQKIALADSKKRIQQYDEAMRLGNIAYSQTNSDEAIRQADVALAAKPGDVAATKLEADAHAQKDAVEVSKNKQQRYDEAMRLGNVAYSQTNSDEAMRQADVALAAKHGDGAAQGLKTKAEEQKRQVALKQQQQQQYDAAMQAATNAVTRKNFNEATNQLNKALQVKPDDTAALAYLKSTVRPELDFSSYMNSAQQALPKDPSNALSFVSAALILKPENPAATQLRDKVKKFITDYSDVVNQAQIAYQQTNYSEAITMADKILMIKKDDQAMQGLKTEILRRSDEEFVRLLDEFNVTVPDGIRPPKGKKKSTLGAIGDAVKPYYNYEVDKLEKVYRTGNWLRENNRQAKLQELRDHIKIWD